MLLAFGGAALPAASALLWLLAIGGPACAVIVALAIPTDGVGAADDAARGTSAGAVHVLRDGTALLFQGIGWACAIATAAALLGWGPGRALREVSAGRSRSLFVVGLVATLALPTYLLSWCWWQAFPPGSSVGDWAVRHELVPTLRAACLGAGLLAWAWPVAAIAVAALGRGGEHAAAMRLDGGSLRARLRLAWHEDRSGLLVGAAAVAVLVFSNTTAFDLAQVRSWGFELRTLDARGATAVELLRAALPAMVVAAVGGVVVWRWAGAVSAEHRGAQVVVRRIGAGPWLILAVSVVTPLALLVGRLNLRSAVGEFARLYTRPLVGTLADALIVGGLAAVLAAGLAIRFLRASRWARIAASIESIGWCVATFTPAMAIVAALVAAYNHAWSALVYDTPAAALLGQLALAGGLAALVARHAARSVPRTRLDAIRLEAGATSVGLLRAAGPAVGAASIVAFCLGGTLVLGEVVIGPRLLPASTQVLATSILNGIHYQDPETVMLATLMQVMAAALAALGAVWIWRRTALPASAGRDGARAAFPTTAILAAAVILASPGCDDRAADGTSGLLPATGRFGNRGDAPGTFDFPRAIAADPAHGWVYVIDKTARVQRFDEGGRFQRQWTMPDSTVGKPTGVTVGPDGTVWVADTHYHRVIAYDPDGREIRRFGRYGTGSGEFIYPTDVAEAPNGDLYVAEYGGNDRVQVFSPEGEFRFAFGRFGEGEGEFRRPQAIVFDEVGEELFIADACNHRIVVTDREGRWIRTFGGAGTAPGALAFPYGMDRLGDGSLLVVEFGNQRVQRFDREGRALGCWGTAGDSPGQLRTPWGVAVGSSTICVLDSGNARVQTMTLP